MSAAPHPLIAGAGLAGLIAAHAWPSASVFEPQQRMAAPHRAILRFRSDVVSRLTGIEFRKVRVRKAIYEGWRTPRAGFVSPNIRSANLYAQKVLGGLVGDRSIWNIDPVDRYIAPEDFYERLLEVVGSRIRWGEPVPLDRRAAHPIISTAPLPSMLLVLGRMDKYGESLPFQRAPIEVRRWRVKGADVFQTIYFPEESHSLYRASITGDLLIAEYAHSENPYPDDSEALLCEAFGLGERVALELLDSTHQRYGKIVPLEDALRKRILFDLTHKEHIYSLGRFATWRNILLDDVADDIAVIKRLMASGAAYDLRKAAS